MAEPVEDPPFHRGSRGGGLPTSPSAPPPRGARQGRRGRRRRQQASQLRPTPQVQARPPLNVAPVDKDGNYLFCVVLLEVYGNASAHAEVRRRCLNYMEAVAEHYCNFVAGATPPSPKTTTTTMRDTTRGQRGARQQWGGVRQRWGANLPVNQLGKKKTTIQRGREKSTGGRNNCVYW